MSDFNSLISYLAKTSVKKEQSMIVTVRRIEHSEHEYFAYAKSLCGKATYFLYFSDDIFGAIVLHNFVEMLSRFFEKEDVQVKLHDRTVHLHNEHLLLILREKQKKEP